MSTDNKIQKLEDEIKNLKEQLVNQIKQNKLKDDIVLHQSKMAAMGEMINNISHQYRQPLMEISTLLIHCEAKIKLFDGISTEETLEMIEKSSKILKFMSTTIDDFRNFFATDKIQEQFSVSEAISTVVNMLNYSLLKNNIKLDIVIKKNIKLDGVKNEFVQVLLNIITNAIDVIISREVEHGKIILKTYEKDSEHILEIEDNAGGIDLDPIEQVFKPYFTYKKENGTGVGLFMSKLIIEQNFEASLSVDNKNDGACFSIVL